MKMLAEHLEASGNAKVSDVLTGYNSKHMLKSMCANS
jgi:hypothetical protein